MEEIIKLLKCRAVSSSHIGLLIIVTISFLPESTIVSVTPVKIPTGVFMKFDNLVLKFIWQ